MEGASPTAASGPAAGLLPRGGAGWGARAPGRCAV